MTRFTNSFRLITITAWLLFFTFPLLLVTGQGNSTWTLLQSPYYWQFCLCYFVIFYLNAKLLTPRLLLKKKYAVYALVILLLGAGVYSIKPFDDLIHESRSLGYIAIPPMLSPDGEPPRFNDDSRNSRPLPPPSFDDSRGPGRFPARDITSLFIFLIVLTLSTATETTARWQVTERRAANAEMEKARAELSFLKAQINPHFLFNTLNNIYSLAVTGNAKTADSIMKLSNIMRFVTDDVREEKIPLDREVECIRDYIDLQKLRLGKNADITFEAIGNIDHQSISPMILLTFVENAFKHGISKRSPSPIVIKIKASHDKIYFYCQNQNFKHQTKQDRNGIGIDNTKKRLQHVYPANHQLTIHCDDTIFTVTLEINRT